MTLLIVFHLGCWNVCFYYHRVVKTKKKCKYINWSNLRKLTWIGVSQDSLLTWLNVLCSKIVCFCSVGNGGKNVIDSWCLNFLYLIRWLNQNGCNCLKFCDGIKVTVGLAIHTVLMTVMKFRCLWTLQERAQMGSALATFYSIFLEGWQIMDRWPCNL